MDGTLDSDLDLYADEIKRWNRYRLRSEIRRLNKAQSSWEVVLDRYGCGRGMINLAVAMRSIVANRLKALGEHHGSVTEESEGAGSKQGPQGAIVEGAGRGRNYLLPAEPVSLL